MTSITINEGFFDDPLFAQKAYTEREAALWLLCHAAEKDTNQLRRGEVYFPLRVLARVWNWTVRKVSEYLSKLERKGWLKKPELYHNRNRKAEPSTPVQEGAKMVISLCKFDDFQKQPEREQENSGTYNRNPIDIYIPLDQTINPRMDTYPDPSGNISPRTHTSKQIKPAAPAVAFESKSTTESLFPDLEPPAKADKPSGGGIVWTGRCGLYLTEADWDAKRRTYHKIPDFKAALDAYSDSLGDKTTTAGAFRGLAKYLNAQHQFWASRPPPKTEKPKTNRARTGVLFSY